MWEFAIFAIHYHIYDAVAVGYDCVDCEWREKVLAFSLFLLLIVRSCQKLRVTLSQSNPLICWEAVEIFLTSRPKNYLNLIVMSLWDWLLAAWIYEELFDDDSDNSSHNNTRDYDSSYNYDDYEEDY